MTTNPNSIAVASLMEKQANIFRFLTPMVGAVKNVGKRFGAAYNSAIYQPAGVYKTIFLDPYLRKRYGEFISTPPKYGVPSVKGKQRFDLVQRILDDAVDDPRIALKSHDSNLLNPKFSDAYYDTDNAQIVLEGYKALSPGVAAHEIGHATIPQTRIGNYINRLYYATHAGNSTMPNIIRYPLKGISTLAEEARASINGYKLLRQRYNLPRKDALESFLGYPGYLLLHLTDYGLAGGTGMFAYKLFKHLSSNNARNSTAA